jgi:plasmid stability protein
VLSTTAPFGMAQLLVRNLPETLVKKLKRRAVEHGVSAEEEHRRLLHEALAAPAPGVPSAIEHLLSPKGRVDELPVPHRHSSTHRDVIF